MGEGTYTALEVLIWTRTLTPCVRRRLVVVVSCASSPVSNKRRVKATCHHNADQIMIREPKSKDASCRSVSPSNAHLLSTREALS